MTFGYAFRTFSMPILIIWMRGRTSLMIQSILKASLSLLRSYTVTVRNWSSLWYVPSSFSQGPSGACSSLSLQPPPCLAPHFPVSFLCLELEARSFTVFVLFLGSSHLQQLFPQQPLRPVRQGFQHEDMGECFRWGDSTHWGGN